MELRVAVPVVLLASLLFTACGSGSDPASNPPDTETPVCGNGRVEDGEACDDGNDDNTDGCTNECELARCGDGFVQAGEQCDDGNDDPTDGCLNDCRTAFCGDGFVQAGVEECDDGNQSNNDACLTNCVKNTCGDGFVHEGVEACDDGNDVDDDACSNSCVQATCGDGIKQDDELCDDGNDVETDDCTSACLPARCGDGFVQAGEECDEGEANSNTGSCTTECKRPACGDGFVQGDEECDDGEANGDDAACLTTCVANVCGDGFVRAGVEECDEGESNSDTGSCTTQCKLPACGDGLLQPGEECDDGALNGPTAACLTTCEANVCGDGFLHVGVEACDDGALNSDTGACRPGCILNTCGDGFVRAGVEECDEGSANSNTGTCTTQCRLPRCGDGFVQAGEECDEGIGNSDAPDSSCRTICLLPTCGDGIVDSDEACDDGNDVDSDACSNDCTINGDDCSSPALLALDPTTYAFTVAGDTTTASADYGAGCAPSNNNGDLIYQLTSPIHGRWTISMNPSFDAVLTVRTTCTSSSSERACADEFGNSGAETVVVDLQQGETVFILADGYGDATANEGTFTLSGSVAPFLPDGAACDPTGAANVCISGVCDPMTLECRAPVCGNGIVEANEPCDDGNTDDADACSNDCTVNGDTCASPAIITFDPVDHSFVVSSNTTGVGADFNLSCTSTSLNGDLVFQLTSPISGRWTVDMTGVHDMALAVRTSCLDSSSEIDCSDSGLDVGIPEQVVFDLLQGETVYLIADGWGTFIRNEGAFTLAGTVTPFVGVGDPCDPAGVVGLCPPGSQCDTNSLTCRGSVCGDGVTESGEECDDGNGVDTDACSNACRLNGDSCAAPIVLEHDPVTYGFTVSDDTTGRRADMSTGCSVTDDSGDLVYQLTSPIAGRWTVTMTASFDAVVAARSSCANVNTEVSCADATGSGAETIVLDLLQGETVFIVADGWSLFGPSEGSFTLTGTVVPFVAPGDPCDPTGATNVCAPGSQCDDMTATCRSSVCGNGVVESGEPCDDGNTIDDDACSNACTINGDTCAAPVIIRTDPLTHGFTVSSNTAGAGADYDLSCTDSALNGDVVFQLTSPVGARWTVEMTGGHDMALAVRTACAAVSTELDCSDSGFDVGIPEEVVFDLLQGETVYLIADGWGGMRNEGPFTLTGTAMPFAGPGDPCDLAGTSAICAPGSQCDAMTLTCRASVCGNAVVESGEECDDGNTVDEDGCTNTCKRRGDRCTLPWDLRLVDTDPAPESIAVTGDLSTYNNDHRPACTTSPTSTSNYRDVVYALTGNGATDEYWTLTLTGGTSSSLVLDVKDACVTRNARVACTYGATSTTPKSVSFWLGANETVYVWVDTESTSASTFTLTGTVMQGLAVGNACDPAGVANMCEMEAACDAGICVAAVCGNGTREGVEECDDDNVVDNDGCSANCDREGDTCNAPFDLNLLNTSTMPDQWRHAGTLAGMNPNYGGSCASSGRWNDVVYSFTAPAAGHYWFRQLNINNDVVMFLSDVCPPTEVDHEIACTDDPEELTVSLAANQTVYLFLGPWNFSSLPTDLSYVIAVDKL